MKALICCIFLFSVNSLYACSCGDILDLKTQQRKSFLESRLIMIGDVISVDGNRYLIKVVEVLKGKVVSDTLEGTQMSTCSMTPTLGRWLFYQEPIYFQEDSTSKESFAYSICGMSRSFENPQEVYVEEYVGIVEKPTRKKVYRRFRKDYISKAEYKKEIEAIRKIARKDLEIEIVELRSKYSK